MINCSDVASEIYLQMSLFVQKEYQLSKKYQCFNNGLSHDCFRMGRYYY